MRDPANKWSRRINDSLGRLKSVEEDPNGSIGTFVNSGGLAYSTSYTYDSRDQLKSVIQGGRDRSFTYDPLGRLQTVVSPEMGAEGTPNGTITYSYDPAGNLISKFGRDGHQPGVSQRHWSFFLNVFEVFYLNPRPGLPLPFRIKFAPMPRSRLESNT
jgi:YD repeat-containing protein